MLGSFFGNLAFAAPWVLGFLAVLPAIWWLLRLLPPSPRKIRFPALMLLRGLATPEKTPAHMPWWLLLLRLLIAALVILGLARPVLDPRPVLKSGGAALIAIDNDWAAARAWDARQDALHRLIAEAEREDRPVMLLPTAPSASGEPLHVMGPMAAKAAFVAARDLAPEPWPTDWQAAQAQLGKIHPQDVAWSAWLNSGLGDHAAQDFYDTLKSYGTLKETRVFGDAGETPIYLLAPPHNGDNSFAVLRAMSNGLAAVAVVARDRTGRELARQTAHFEAGANRAPFAFHLPATVRNRAARLEIEGTPSAATTILLDESWQRRPVGIIGNPSEAEEHSLLSGVYYVERALKPFADLHVGSLGDLLKQNMAVLIATDATAFDTHDVTAMADWIEKGGVLVRFAGPRLAETQNPAEAAILPVALRTGDRAMGGSMSWAKPQKLGPFPTASPFHGLTLPDDVSIKRQILAEPSAALAAHTWAALQDGTPLVTAKNMGRGLSVLFHVPARPLWSNLPLSGLFVDMLRRIVDLSAGMGSAANFITLAPVTALDAFGDEIPPGPVAAPLKSEDMAATPPSPHHPPGLYGAGGAARAFNLGAALGLPQAISGIATESYRQPHSETELRPAFLVAAFVLLLLDFLIGLWLRGLGPRRGTAVLMILFMLAGFAAPAHADTVQQAIEFTSKTYLAYVETGNPAIDRLSQEGLAGLARILERRTSLNDVGVTDVDPKNDTLVLFPLLYWPLTPAEAPLSPEAAARVNDYLRHGGMILFDTGMSGGAMAPGAMQHILAGVEIPPLIRIPDNHVLHRTFYLLNRFPGRFIGDGLWLEPLDLSSYDGVATVIAGSGDWAAAWAIDANGNPLYPCTPGGEEQREMAYRFGVNVVMYALTGNYKSDQLHVQALLEREGK
ncbi:MAG TPA: DUF4159 domain-containing protein [Alphaproteobacteria bacterium]|nr:DUF4159 domain-containing protein [Alphaproteobacteria bacterium]